ncbi:hypothetical protein [Azospira restricta]|uniref:Uncharacterized protein n=1 Tax=Azospira restricta TaxID=404405 RepID=A0A974SRL4_9RHOO|nr:hypothetical protein [Azospira restricta]QRJ65053.1 hypothetical protein IWH25_06850 [Azospira restricta]
MLNLDLRKIYRFAPVALKPAEPLPIGAMYYYECLDCQGIVNSVPHTPAQCPCGNLSGAAGKVEIRDPNRLRVMTGKLK